MTVIWTAAAKADLIEIGDYISADNPPRAVSLVNEIVAAGEAIADMPKAFSLVPHLEHQGIRRRVYGRYLIFYTLEAGSVQILHVTHTARDYIRAMFSED